MSEEEYQDMDPDDIPEEYWICWGCGGCTQGSNRTTDITVTSFDPETGDEEEYDRVLCQTCTGELERWIEHRRNLRSSIQKVIPNE